MITVNMTITWYAPAEKLPGSLTPVHGFMGYGRYLTLRYHHSIDEWLKMTSGEEVDPPLAWCYFPGLDRELQEQLEKEQTC